MKAQETNVSGFSTMSSAIEFADNYSNWIVDNFRPYIGTSILEIGTGQGNFKQFLSNAKTYVSIDVSDEVLERAAQRDSAGIYIQTDISTPDCLDKVKGFKFDTALCTNVLEHIENDKAAIQNIIELLDTGGRLLLFIPAFQALYSDMDRLAGHYRRYSKKTVSDLFGNNILLEQLEYFNPIGGLGWWINKFIPHRDLDSASINTQIKLFDRYIVPVSKLLNPISKNWFGQSLVCVAKKQS